MMPFLTYEFRSKVNFQIFFKAIYHFAPGFYWLRTENDLDGPGLVACTQRTRVVIRDSSTCYARVF